MRAVRARRGMVLGFAVFIVILGGGSAAWACTPGAGIDSISPSSGVPGTTVTVSVRQFHADLPVELRWEGSQGRLLGSAVARADGTAQITASIPADAQPATQGRVVLAIQHKDGTPFLARSTFTVTEPQGQTTKGQSGGGPEGLRPSERVVVPVQKPVPAPQVDPVSSADSAPLPSTPVGAPAHSAAPAPQAVAPARLLAEATPEPQLSPDVPPARSRPAELQTTTPPASPVLVDEAAPELVAPAAPRDLPAVARASTPTPSADSSPASFGSPSPSDGVSPGVLGIGLLAVGLVTLFAGFTVAEARRRRVLVSLPAER